MEENENYKDMICSVCKKKKVKFVTTSLSSYNYGFCSKVCLANNAIKHFNLKNIKN